MPFANGPVAGTTLVRDAIKSPDYAPGVSGWSINRDGTVEFLNAVLRGGASSPNYVPGVSGWSIGDDGIAEFSDATLRGTVIAGADPGSRVELDPSGVIRIYDSSDLLVIEIDGDGIRMTNGVVSPITGFERGGTGDAPLFVWRGNRPRLHTNGAVYRCTADDTLTTTSTLVPGLSQVLTSRAPGATWTVTAAVDLDVTTASAAVATGELWVGPTFGPMVQQTGLATFRANTSAARATVFQQWEGNCDPSGFTRFDLMHRKTAAAGVSEVKANHTTMRVQILENWQTT